MWHDAPLFRSIIHSNAQGGISRAWGHGRKVGDGDESGVTVGLRLGGDRNSDWIGRPGDGAAPTGEYVAGRDSSESDRRVDGIEAQGGLNGHIAAGRGKGATPHRHGKG